MKKKNRSSTKSKNGINTKFYRHMCGVIYEYNKVIYLFEGINPKFKYKNVKIQVNNN